MSAARAAPDSERKGPSHRETPNRSTHDHHVGFPSAPFGPLRTPAKREEPSGCHAPGKTLGGAVGRCSNVGEMVAKRGTVVAATGKENR